MGVKIKVLISFKLFVNHKFHHTNQNFETYKNHVKMDKVVDMAMYILDRELLHMRCILIHPTWKLDSLWICCQFVSNDLKDTCLRSLKLVSVSNKLKKQPPGCKLLQNFVLGE